jgi:hypothetical protein
VPCQDIHGADTRAGGKSITTAPANQGIYRILLMGVGGSRGAIPVNRPDQGGSRFFFSRITIVGQPTLLGTGLNCYRCPWLAVKSLTSA